MPRYYFNLRDGTAGVSDPDGTSLPDDAAASERAAQLARELMRQSEVKRSHWQLDVCDEGQGSVQSAVRRGGPYD